MILTFQLEISRLMCICWHSFFNRYTCFCVSYIIVISDRIGHTLFNLYVFGFAYTHRHKRHVSHSYRAFSCQTSGATETDWLELIKIRYSVTQIYENKNENMFVCWTYWFIA